MGRADALTVERGGLRNVWLVNGYELKQTPFGEGVVIHDLDGLTKAVCLALTDKPGLLTGVEFRYIRSAGMLLSQPALGKLMGIDGQSVARWEKTGRVPRWADKLALAARPPESFAPDHVVSEHHTQAYTEPSHRFLD